jgi:site-specific recombinase XerD
LVKNLRRRDVDISKKIIIVRRSKNESSHRILPLNASALRAMEKMIVRADALGFTEPDH